MNNKIKIQRIMIKQSKLRIKDKKNKYNKMNKKYKMKGNKSLRKYKN